VLVEEVVRRNRRRIVLITVVSLVNYWVFFCLLLGALMVPGLLLHRDTPVPLLAAMAVILGTIGAVRAVVGQLRSMPTRTLDELGAVEIGPGELPVVEGLLHALAIAVGGPPVRAALVADDAPNALSVGRRPADTTIVVTSGLVQTLALDELEAVLAAEMWAVRRYDTAMQTVTLACAGDAIATHASFSDHWQDPRAWLPVVVTFPTMLVAELMRALMLRRADYGADELAAATTRHPEALRRAMVKLRDDPKVVATLDLRTAPLWFEPLPHGDGARVEDYEAVSLTPSLDERLARLDELFTTR
jgi:heat shock protein HtpX